MKVIVPLCAALIAAAPSSAHAAGEVFGGVLAHAVDTPLSLDSGKEDGVDVELGYRGERLGRTPFQPYVLAHVNLNGETSFAAAGLSAKFGDAFYVRPALGIAVHNGSAANSTHVGHDHIDFGSRILFAPEVSVGARIGARASIEASLVHFSHATLFSSQNPGIDNIGARFNWKL